VIVGEPFGQAATAMAILSVDGHGYGLALAAIEDVLSLSKVTSLPTPVAPRWQSLNPQLVDFRGRTLLVIDPRRLVAAVTVMAAAA
jgi:chemotaxis signal transduction protein